MAMTGTFRTALNGFNRQDVAAYLESAAARYTALKEENNQLRQKCAELEEKLGAAENAQSEPEPAANAAQSPAVPSGGQTAQNAEETAALTAELNAMKAENAELLLRAEIAEEQITRNADKVAEYDALRERLSTLELEASRRALEIERSAEAQALELRQAARQEEAAFRLRREDAARQFQASLRKAAVSAGLSAKLVNGELERLAASLQEIAASLETTAGSLEPAQNAADGAEGGLQ